MRKYLAAVSIATALAAASGVVVHTVADSGAQGDTAGVFSAVDAAADVRTDAPEVVADGSYLQIMRATSIEEDDVRWNCAVHGDAHCGPFVVRFAPSA
jgi:hypothetical protein